MAKNSITQYDTTASNNTDVGNIQIEGSDDVANFDNALRELMKHIADFNTGDSFIHDTYKIADSDDETKLAKFDAGSITAGQTRVFNFPDLSGTIALLSDLTAPAPDAIVEDQKGSATSAGTFTSGDWRTRTLNTIVRDIDSVMSISSSQFTPNADGWVEWSCPAYAVNRHSSRIYNVTDSVVAGVGSAEYAHPSSDVQNRSVGGCFVESGKTYRIEHRSLATKTNDGLGISSTYQTSVYSRLLFWRT